MFHARDTSDSQSFLPNADKLEYSAGIVPVIKLLLRLSSFNAAKSASDSGNLPLKLFLLRSSLSVCVLQNRKLVMKS